ncbi:MAG: prolipoprotein diacylglyceryl transferase [Deltaproteobacteria bacterium]|nr:prolipoprotein diacylglyceryl transferase [Deltaproteobacteria bacterium]
MRPVLFKFGSIVFPSYTFMIMVGVLVATWLGLKVLKERGLPVVYGLDMAMIGIVAGFLGARIVHVLVEAPAYYLESPVRVFYFWQGGFVSWGAYVAVMVSFYFYLRWRRVPIAAYFDAFAFGIPMAIFFGRIGCLLTGCCFGKPTDFFIHLTFTNPASTAYQFYPNMPLHATQLYLMLNVLIIQGVIWWIYKKHWRFQGQLFSVSVALYAVGRFFIEFLRGDADRGVYFGGNISSGQIFMVALFIFAMGLYFYFKRKALPPPPLPS